MRVKKHLIVFLLLASLGIWQTDAHAAARRNHTVQKGQTLSAIARRYAVPVPSLAGANRLDEETVLKPGQELVVPNTNEIFVAPGQTLSEIAQSLGVSVGELCRHNRIDEAAALKVGSRLRVPPEGAGRERRNLRRRKGRAAPDRSTRAMFYRASSHQRRTITLLDRKGRVRRAARRQLGQLMRSRKSHKVRLPNQRLVQLLARISDHFGNKPIHIISGYRQAGGYTHRTSRHTMGRALDFRIPGVSNRRLRDYCRKLPKVGVGYYPRSTFVHLDVRGSSGYWVDVSRPGERPRYRREKKWAEADSANAKIRTTVAAAAPPSHRRAEEADEDPALPAEN